MSSKQPAVLIVHGAYNLPSIWAPFVSKLENVGFTVSCPRLPTCGDSRPPTADLAADVAVIRKAANTMKAAGHPIIVLAHSFGGVVATQSITPDLYAASSTAPGVVRLIYLCAFLVQPENTLSDVFAKHGFLSKVDLTINDDGTAIPKNASDSFYNDMDNATAENYTRQNVTHNLGLVGQQQVINSPWKDIQSLYVLCKQDMAIMLPLQEAMISDANASGASMGKGMEIVELDASHHPFLSLPIEVVKVVEDVWQTTKEGK